VLPNEYPHYVAVLIPEESYGYDVIQIEGTDETVDLEDVVKMYHKLLREYAQACKLLQAYKEGIR